MIRNDETFNDPLRVAAGSGKALAMPLPVNTRFAHAEVRRLHAELKLDLVLAARQQLSSVVGIINGLIGQYVLFD